MHVKDILLTQQMSTDTALIYKNVTISYQELHRKAARLSKLINHQQRELIILYLPNCTEYIMAYFGALYANAVIMPIHYAETNYKVKSKADVYNVSLIITLRTKEEEFSDYKGAILYIDENLQMEYKNKIYEIDTSKYTFGTDIILMIETSGSTGNPKIIMLTNKNIISNIKSYHHVVPLISEEITLIISPFTSSYGNTCELLFYLMYHKPIVIFDGLFRIGKLLRMISKYKVTRAHVTSPILMQLANVSGGLLSQYDLTSLKLLDFGSCFFPKNLLPVLVDKYPKVILIQNYGLSEASPLVTSLGQKDWYTKFGSVGKAILGVECRIESVTGMDKNEGELCVKGDNVMLGYYNNSEATSKVIIDGWLHTGDLVSMDDDGYFNYLGRNNRTIICNGNRIRPEEIEEVLMGINKIQSVFVYGKPDEIRGETIQAAVILKKDCQLSEEDIYKHCKIYLAQFKIPYKIHIKNSLETTSTGKIKLSQFC